VRLGWCPRDKGQAREIAEAPEWQDVYLSPGDAGRFVACAVEAPQSLRWAGAYAPSRPLRPGAYDMGPARRLTGYEPCDAWPTGAEEMLDPLTPRPPLPPRGEGE